MNERAFAASRWTGYAPRSTNRLPSRPHPLPSIVAGLRLKSVVHDFSVFVSDALAEALLSSDLADDFAVACDLVGWKLVPLDGHSEPLLNRLPLCPSWCEVPRIRST